jgi:hypothetical protein
LWVVCVCADPRRMPPLTCIQGTFACSGAARRFYGHHMHIRPASSCKKPWAITSNPC